MQIGLIPSVQKGAESITFGCWKSHHRAWHGSKAPAALLVPLQADSPSCYADLLPSTWTVPVEHGIGPWFQGIQAISSFADLSVWFSESSWAVFPNGSNKTGFVWRWGTQNVFPGCQAEWISDSSCSDQFMPTNCLCSIAMPMEICLS